MHLYKNKFIVLLLFKNYFCDTMYIIFIYYALWLYLKIL